MRSPYRSMAGSTQLDPVQSWTGGRGDRVLNKEIAKITKGQSAAKLVSTNRTQVHIRCSCTACPSISNLCESILKAALPGHLPALSIRAPGENLRGKHVCDTTALNSTAVEDYSNQPSLRDLCDLFVQKSVFASSCESITPATAARARTRLRRRKTTSR